MFYIFTHVHLFFIGLARGHLKGDIVGTRKWLFNEPAGDWSRTDSSELEVDFYYIRDTRIKSYSKSLLQLHTIEEFRYLKLILKISLLKFFLNGFDDKFQKCINGSISSLTFYQKILGGFIP